MSARTIRPGDRLRVVDVTDCKDGKGRKPPFALGEIVSCDRLSASGLVRLVGKHGFWRPHRFAPEASS